MEDFALRYKLTLWSDSLLLDSNRVLIGERMKDGTWAIGRVLVTDDMMDSYIYDMIRNGDILKVTPNA